MSEDRIDSIIDIKAVQAELDLTKSGINELIALIQSVKGKALDITGAKSVSEVKGLSKELETLVDKTNVAANATIKAADAQTKLSEATKKAADANRTEAASQTELAQALAKNKVAQKELTDAKKALNDEFKAGSIGQDTYIESLGQVEQAQVALKISASDMQKALNNIERESQAAGGSLDELRAQLNLATQAFDKLSAEEREGDTGQALKDKVNSLLEAVSKQEQATGRFQRNVGNYANSLSGAFSKISDEISKLQAKQAALVQQQSGNPVGFKFGGGEDELNKTTAALNQLTQAQQIGFKVGANQTQQVRQLQNAYVAFAQSGTQSIEFLDKFKAEVGKVTDDVNDLKQSIKLAASDTRQLDVLIGTAQAIAGGFGIAQGAAALFGDESENVQRTLVKLNGIMTVLNGLQAIQNELKKKDNILTIVQTNLQKAYTAIIGTSTGALKTFKTALAATGVGIFLVAIGALILAFDKIKAAMTGISKEQQNLIDQAEKRVEQEDMNKELLDAQEQSLKRLGFSEEQITQQKIEQLQLNKQAKLDLLEARRLTLDSQREAQKRSFSIIKTIVDVITIPITAISKVLGAITGKKLPTIGDIVGEQLFDPNKVDKEFKELSDKIKLETTQIQGEVDGLLNGLDEKRKQAREKNKKDYEKHLKELEELNQRNAKAQYEIDKLNAESRLRLFQKGIDDESELEKARAAGLTGSDLKSVEQKVQGERLSSLQGFIIEKINIIEKEAEFEKLKAGLTAKEIEAIERKKQDGISQVLEEAIEKRIGIITKGTQEEKELYKSVAASISESIKFGVDQANEELKKSIDKEAELIKQRKDLYKQLYNEITGFAFDFIKNSIDKEKNAIQDQIDLLEERKQKDIEVANQTITNAQDKAAAISTIEARANAEHEALERKQRQLDIQRARFEKAQNVANIISETALAVVRALGARPWTPANIALAAVVGAIGVVQAARAAAQPIPRFKDGGEVKETGLIMVGDGGKHEGVKLPDGSLMKTPNVNTLMYAEKGTKIYPDYNKMMFKATLTDVPKWSSPKVTTDTSTPVIVASLNKVEKAIKRIPQTQFVVDNIISKKVRQG